MTEKDIQELIINEFEPWIYNDINQAGEKLGVIDADDLPEIVTGLFSKFTIINKPQSIEDYKDHSVRGQEEYKLKK